MTRLFYGFLFVFALSCMPFTVGCGGSGDNTVIEQEATEAELDQEMEDYEKEMEKGAEEATKF